MYFAKLAGKLPIHSTAVVRIGQAEDDVEQVPKSDLMVGLKRPVGKEGVLSIGGAKSALSRATL